MKNLKKNKNSMKYLLINSGTINNCFSNFNGKGNGGGNNDDYYIMVIAAYLSYYCQK